MKKDKSKKKKKKFKEFQNITFISWIDKYKSIIDILMILILFCTLLFTCSTLKEIKTQRLKAYEPELRISSSKFNMICKIDNVNFSKVKDHTICFNLITYNKTIDSSLLIFPEDTRTGKKTIDWLVVPTRGNNFALPLHNIGQGVALDVQISYQIDTSEFLDLFNNYDVFQNFDTIYYSLKDKCFIYGYKDDLFWIQDYHYTTNFQYVINYAVDKDYKMYLPENYFKLIALWHDFIMENNLNAGFFKTVYPELHDTIPLPFKHPPLYITISYKDINDVLYCRNFKCYYNPPDYFSTPTRKIEYHGEMVVEYLGKN